MVQRVECRIRNCAFNYDFYCFTLFCSTTASAIALFRQTQITYNHTELQILLLISTAVNLIDITDTLIPIKNTIIIIALKGAIRHFYFLQSPHCAANCLQHACSSGPDAIVCKSCATH